MFGFVDWFDDVWVWVLDCVVLWFPVMVVIVMGSLLRWLFWVWVYRSDFSAFCGAIWFWV